MNQQIQKALLGVRRNSSGKSIIFKRNKTKPYTRDSFDVNTPIYFRKLFKYCERLGKPRVLIKYINPYLYPTIKGAKKLMKTLSTQLRLSANGKESDDRSPEVTPEHVPEKTPETYPEVPGGKPANENQ